MAGRTGKRTLGQTEERMTQRNGKQTAGWMGKQTLGLTVGAVNVVGEANKAMTTGPMGKQTL